MKTKFFPLMLVLAVVFVAGCAGRGPSTSSNAVIITSFGPEIDEVEPADTVSVIGLIENIGGAKATNVKAKLLGLTDEWGFGEGREIGVRDLLPPDPARNLQGDVEELVWFLDPPPKKVTLDYDMELRVFFDYETFSENLIRVATQDYIDSFQSAQKQAERNKLGVTTSIPSSGPISVTLFSRSTILRQNVKETTVTVDIQNVGAGKPDNDQIEISIKSGGKKLECSGIEGGKVRLAQGKSRQLRCIVDISEITERGWEEVPISIELDYTYWVSSLSSIRVIGEEIA